MRPRRLLHGTLTALLGIAAAGCDSRPVPRQSLLASRVAAPPPATAAAPSGPVTPLEPACSDSLESGALQCAAGAAQRTGDTLAIELSGGQVLKWVDNHEQSDAFVSYLYAGLLGGSSGTAAFHMLSVEGRENHWIELVNARTGDSISIAGMPVLSPDGARIAVGEMDLASCEGPNALEVWRITSDVPVREFTLDPWDCVKERGWGASDLEWVSRDTLSVLRSTLPRSQTRREAADYDTSRARLVRGSTGWTLSQRSR